MSWGEMKISDRLELSSKYSVGFEHEKWMGEIPTIDFGPYLLVKPVPPFAGAVVRFFVYDRTSPEEQISVYLDCYNMLGFYRQPYWEAYPVEGDTFRVPMASVSELVRKLEAEFSRRRLGAK